MECGKQELLQGEKTKFWYAGDLGGVEMLHARYRKHSFGKHTHEGFAVGVIRHGVEGFFGSAQQSVKVCILRGFLESDVFDL